MSDLIERGEVFKALWARHKHEGMGLDALITMEDALGAVVSIPAVDTVEAKHGRWLECEDGWGDVHYQCSECGQEWNLDAGTPKENNMNYCPNCGAKMDGGEKDEQ